MLNYWKYKDNKYLAIKNIPSIKRIKSVRVIIIVAIIIIRDRNDFIVNSIRLLSSSRLKKDFIVKDVRSDDELKMV